MLLALRRFPPATPSSQILGKRGQKLLKQHFGNLEPWRCGSLGKIIWTFEHRMDGKQKDQSQVYDEEDGYFHIDLPERSCWSSKTNLNSEPATQVRWFTWIPQNSTYFPFHSCATTLIYFISSAPLPKIGHRNKHGFCSVFKAFIYG